MSSSNNLAPAPSNPWEVGPDEQDWLELAEALQREAEMHSSDADVQETTTRPHDPRLNVEVKDYAPRLLSDYGEGNVPVNNNAAAIRKHAENKAEAQGLDQAPSWLNEKSLGVIHGRLRERVFTDVAPREVFVVGQNGKGVRIFNFGEPLSAERQRDCEKFVDIVTQYMGDQMYDFVTDIVIADFATGKGGAQEDEHDLAGLAYPGNGLILANTAILHDDAPADATAGGSSFLQTLTHEYAHLAHGDVRRDAQARKELEAFAAAIGWNMEGMHENGHDWLAKGADNQPYAPLYTRPHVISMPADGSPTEYGALNPMESFGETNKHAMLGSAVMADMTETSDAWLAHLQTRMLQPGEKVADRPVAAALDRKPITMTRYSGANIRYPS